jgi:uncharacterized membrane protein YfbV (UPF0208 family)
MTVEESATMAKTAALHQEQRRNIWEGTQAAIALMVSIATMTVCLILVLRGETIAALQLMSSAFFLIIGFYFGRTRTAVTMQEDLRASKESEQP